MGMGTEGILEEVAEPDAGVDVDGEVREVSSVEPSPDNARVYREGHRTDQALHSAIKSALAW